MVLKIATGPKKGITVGSTKANKELRPMTARAREAIIQILDNMSFDFRNSKALDLYSGIGSLGWEFISNDISSIVFIERNKICAQLLKASAQKIGAAEKVTVFSKSVEDGLSQLGRSFQNHENFDLIFADPPFKIDAFGEISKLILENNLLKKDGILIWHSPARRPIHDNTNQELELIKEKKYGDSLISFFQKLK